MNSKLVKDNKILFESPFPFSEIREMEDRYIVILDIHLDTILNENVYCISKKGEKLWQIEKRDLMSNHSPYIGSEFIDNKLLIYNLRSFGAYVDLDTGKITEMIFIK